MNNISIIGRIGKDPELKQTSTGKDVCSFTVAVSKKFNKEETDWFNVTCWGTQAVYASQYLGKGRLVGISGRMESRKHEDKTYWDLVADNVQGLDKPKGGGAEEYDPFENE